MVPSSTRIFVCTAPVDMRCTQACDALGVQLRCSRHNTPALRASCFARSAAWPCVLQRRSNLRARHLQAGRDRVHTQAGSSKRARLIGDCTHIAFVHDAALLSADTWSRAVEEQSDNPKINKASFVTLGCSTKATTSASGSNHGGVRNPDRQAEGTSPSLEQ
jgi:hypothetical protein